MALVKVPNDKAVLSKFDLDFRHIVIQSFFICLFAHKMKVSFKLQ